MSDIDNEEYETFGVGSAARETQPTAVTVTVATRSDDGSQLEVALVDVSGKGVDAGTRALLLSGAFGGLLGSVTHEEFLPATNRFLLRQQWSAENTSPFFCLRSGCV